MNRHVLRAGMWAALAGGAVSGGLLGLSLARPSWVGRGGTVCGVASGRIEVARVSSGGLDHQSIAWRLGSPSGNSLILTGPGSAWHPSVATAAVSHGTTGGPTTVQTLRVLYVPLWPWLALAGGSALFLWRIAGRSVTPGHCPSCGYDLRGLTADRCPECGTPVRIFRSIVLWALRPGRRRLPIPPSVLSAPLRELFS